MKGRDAVAVRLLAALMRLERAPWPATRRAYAALLTALAVRCEGRPAAVGEVYRWLEAALAPTLAVGAAEARRARRDALAMVAAEIAGLLHRLRAGLDRAKRPNLVSMLRFQVICRARDLQVVERRYRERLRGSLGWDPPAQPPRAERMALAAELIALLDPRLAADRALLLVGQGHTVAEAARRTGVSRQAIYRRRDLLRAEVDGDPS